MLMVSVKNLTVSFGARQLFADVSLQLESGQVTALIGPNGSGKTTLLRTIIGEIQPEEGSVWLRPGARVSYLPQSASEPQPGTPLALCLEALAPLGLDYEHEALACLGRHGISPEEAGLPIESLSSGQRTRVGIACATAGDPDVLILDEPTNHLDAAGVDALAAWIKRSRAAVLVVSHDRYFLDAVADYVAELATDDPRQPARLRTFPGNYSAYRRQLQLEWESAAKLYRHQESEERRLVEAARRRMEWFRQAHRAAGQNDFARARAKKGATRAKAASRRLERFRASRIRKPWEREKVRLDVQEASKTGRRIIVAEGVGAAFGRQLFEGLDLSIMRGDRLGVVGPNGCGKPTLLRMLAAVDEPHSGEVWISPSASVFYFDQNLEMLDVEARVDAAVLDAGAGSRENAMAILAALGIAKRAGQLVGSLSFGERVRLAFACMMAAGFDVLILDEPTNNLDIEAREAIEEALEAWNGTLVAASHDRYFIKRLCTQLLEFGLEGPKMVGTEVLEKEPGGGGTRAGTSAVSRGDAGSPSPEDRMTVEHRLAVLSARLAEPSLSEEEKQALTEEFISLSRALRRG